ncbi:DUF6350 family protein [Trebonia sp.]|uniref:cell division protein PerM n=1 Tax=Trebonia sp. TaxID=2767075 RepID=UPI00261C842C|nr:DUF6350 family protein [Trebonia sp.]
MAGGAAALAAAAGGLAVLVTLTAVGWITAPHVGLGGGLAGVLRSAGVLWLVAHHVEVTVRGVGRIGLLPLGLVLLPGVLLERAGRWMTHGGHVTRLRHVGYAALAIALPYALFTGAVAVASRTPAASASLWQAVIAGFLLALLAGGLGAARALAPWRKLAALLPPRPRSVVLGMVTALAVLTACGALLAGASLAVHLHAYRQAVTSLSPGPAGSALLLIAGLSYLPNSVIWAIAYLLGPGFSFGLGTGVAPSASALGAVPAFPLLAALPAGTKAAFPPWLGFFVLAAPYLAGALAGLMTVRIAPTPTLEAAPLWGLLTGSLAGVVIGFGAKLSGGPLGAGRLASVGPSGAEVALVAVLEVGVTAAVVAGAANWLLLRHHIRKLAVPARQHARAGLAPAAVVPQTRDETDDAGGHRIYYDPWAGQRGD